MARIFITGSTDGLGLAAATSLLQDGHEVVLHARSDERVASLGTVRTKTLGIVVGDLAATTDVRSIANQVNAIGRMDAVIYNAGVYRIDERGSTPEGHANLLAINTLAPYILSALIERPSRQIFLSSSLHRGGEGSLKDFDWTERPWDSDKAYAESKLHAVALAAALARRWPHTISNAVDPGWVRTRMGGGSAPVDLDTGQRTQTWLAVSDELEAMTSGGYWRDRTREAPAREATDPSFQDRLLSQLRDLTGIEIG